MRYWLTSLWLIALAGCVKTTELVSPGRVNIDQTPKLYVACFISPQDTLLTAQVTQTTPNTGNGATAVPPEPNADVVLSDGSRSITLRYDSGLGYYRAKPGGSFSVQTGLTYQLTVSMPDGRRVQASATVPPAVPIGRVLIDSTGTQTPSGQAIRYRATISWAAPGGQHYYRGWGRFVQEVLNPSTKTSGVRISQPDFSVVRLTNADPGSYSTAGSFTLMLPAGATVRTLRTTIGLFNTDINYYQYDAALREQLNTPASAFVGGPVLFSNVAGGFGIFAAYNATYLTL